MPETFLNRCKTEEKEKHNEKKMDGSTLRSISVNGYDDRMWKWQHTGNSKRNTDRDADTGRKALVDEVSRLIVPPCIQRQLRGHAGQDAALLLL